MKKKWMTLAVIAILLLCLFPAPRQKLFVKADLLRYQIKTALTEGNELSITGQAAIVIDQETGRRLFSKNEQKKIYPASTTKIMTALLALEKGELEETVTAGSEITKSDPGESTAFIREGQTLTLKQLLAGLMLPSGNDAARTIAVHISRKVTKNPGLSEDAALAYFAGLMNQKAAELGAGHTHFTNPHGLHNPDHYTTAFDMAVIARAAMEKAAFRDIVSKPVYADRTLTYQSSNKLLSEGSPYYFEGANGIKTGFTSEAGYCLVSSASKNGRKVISVVMHSGKNDVWNDSVQLLSKAF